MSGRKIKIPSQEEKKITVLSDENASLLLKSATQDMTIKSLEDVNSELMLRVAQLETGGM